MEEQPGQSLNDTLSSYLDSRRALLVLDNFEHLLDAVPLLSTLLDRCPALKALVTSRTPLRLIGEHEFPVLQLPLPERNREYDLEAYRRNPAMALFRERAAAVQPGFALTAEIAPIVAEICLRLDGLPLAIELAAARIKLLPPEALLAHLDHPLEILTGGPRDAPARQRSLHDTILWSYNLLQPAEQTLLRRLAVFAGGCTLEAAEAVFAASSATGDCPLPIASVLDGMVSLVETGLVRRIADGGRGLRFALLETVRQFALEEQRIRGELEATRNAHAAV